MRDAVERHDSVKVNTAFNGEFATKDKRANKRDNYKEQRDIHRFARVIRAARHRAYLVSLEEFQERDSGWALSRILNLTINVNKLNLMRAGCQSAMRNSDEMSGDQCSYDNACFA